jgi:F0F1-type ATP synthase membrane subunit c/vacuolar-type H+-ATPase subunit K
VQPSDQPELVCRLRRSWRWRRKAGAAVPGLLAIVGWPSPRRACCGITGLTAETAAGIARNPGASATMFTSFILGMVLIESISIYGLVIGLMIVGKIP